MHADIAVRTADLALAASGTPPRVLDVGCGTGVLLRLLADRLPDAEELSGIDPAAGMIALARTNANDPRVTLWSARAERLPFGDGSFDLVVSTTSFDHWGDQGAGLRECSRVLAPSGHLVLTDLFSRLLAPTLLLGGRDHARTRGRAETLLRAAGFRTMAWHRLYSLIIAAVVATK
jgi:ubiquinone/menaquinone biosynthesis C-methylase UbiE